METSKYDGNRDLEWAVKLNRFTLDYLGIWPKNEQNPWQKLMCNFRVLIAVLGMTLCLVIPSIHSLIKIFGNTLLMLDNLQFTLPVISCAIRIVVLWWKKEAIIPIMNMVAKDWIKTKNDQDRNLMIQRARTARKIIICSYCIMGLQYFFIVGLPVFGMTMRLTPNITDPGKPLPYQSYYVYDVTKRPQYELTFISQGIYVAIGMMGYTGVDNFLSLLIFHICGQLEILQNRLQCLDKYMDCHKVLRYCVARHNSLLSAISIIEDTYNVILLSLFIYFAILFAFYGFRLISLLAEGNNMSAVQLIYFVSSVFNIFVHMCLYCVLGEILVAQCNKIYYAAYTNEWYTMDPKVTEDLLLLMTRGSKPIYLTVGKISPVTMATFCGLLKTSVGYISVLHTTRR
ncbi:PREDICTED: odorant receptor 13a-like [Vollenhovia emeryi]|uniref:odorant receptor 13a-like n=1 Tax=Vollenhovia emeryi TaxID=411798 RepID=UPI0005F49D3C|nr:PREDICTED: odorant receptor 13a-like [Vollenhovia emeryi]